ncbi:TPA: hypothetical protein ACGJQ6_005575, partial [Pseudomonas aeruginosa]
QKLPELGGVDTFLSSQAANLNKKLGAKIGEGRLPYEASRAGVEQAKLAVKETLENATAVSDIIPKSAVRGDYDLVHVYSSKTNSTVSLRVLPGGKYEFYFDFREILKILVAGFGLMIIGEKIFEFRFRSFFMSGSLVCKMLVLFLRFSRSGWVSLDIGEGVLRILSFGSEPKLLGLDEISDDFAYPIQSSNELDRYFGKDLLAVYKYLISDVEDSCVGVYFDFGDCGFSVLESEDNLSIVDGVVRVSDDVALSKLEI